MALFLRSGLATLWLAVFLCNATGSAPDDVASPALRGAAPTPAPEPQRNAVDAGAPREDAAQVAPPQPITAEAAQAVASPPAPEPLQEVGLEVPTLAPASEAPTMAPLVAASGLPAAEELAETDSPPLSSCGSTEDCLQVVDTFLEGQPRTSAPRAGLMQTFGPTPQGGGGPCGQFCQLRPECVADDCRFDPYDSAVAAIYFTRRGKLEDARSILIGFRRLLYASGQLELLRSAYKQSGVAQEWHIDTGNNAWVAMAFAHYAAASGSQCDAAAAREIMQKIVSETSCHASFGGFTGRMRTPHGGYRATEHNIDMFALGRMLGETGVMNEAARFVREMHGFDSEHPDAYATATSGEPRCSDGKIHGMPIAADTQFWNLLSEVDPDPVRKNVSMEFAMRPAAEGGLITEDQDIIGGGARLTGVLFTTAGDGAQWENTAAAVMAAGQYRAVYGDQPPEVTEAASAMHASLKYQLGKYGAVLGSVRGGNFMAYHSPNPPAAFPGGSATGIGWTYLRYPHTAATAWTGLMLLQANPFLPPPQPMPAAAGGWWCAPP